MRARNQQPYSLFQGLELLRHEDLDRLVKKVSSHSVRPDGILSSIFGLPQTGANLLITQAAFLTDAPTLKNPIQTGLSRLTAPTK